MRLRSVALLVLGSVIVHVGVSCASKQLDGSSSPIADAASDVLRDVLGADDVKPAEAGPTAATTIDVVKCDKTAGTTVYAEKAYPGRTKEDLVRVSVLSCAEGTIPDYPCVQFNGAQSIHVRDGSIAVACFKAGEVTLVVPPPL